MAHLKKSTWSEKSLFDKTCQSSVDQTTRHSTSLTENCGFHKNEMFCNKIGAKRFFYLLKLCVVAK